MTGNTKFGKFISTIAYTKVVDLFKMLIYSFSLFFLAESLFLVLFIMAVLLLFIFGILKLLGFG